MTEALRNHLTTLLQNRAHPKTICPSEVARALSPAELEACGVTEWKDVMPLIRNMVLEMRETGTVEIMQRGQLLGMDVGVEDVRGPVRVRKVEHGGNGEH
jgi:hypothetical protein